MKKLTQEDLFTLERYAKIRKDFRQNIMDYKKNRCVGIGPNTTLYFEDRQTIHYQIQEMLRIEKIFEEAGIREELETYNPLIPDGQNLKATFMIEYPDKDERQEALKLLKGIERCVYISVNGFEKVWADADEDLDRENEEKTSSVHFLVFNFTSEMVTAVHKGYDMALGISHESYSYEVNPLPRNVRDALEKDFD